MVQILVKLLLFRKVKLGYIALIIENFLGNYRAANYKEIVENMLTNSQILGANMSIQQDCLNYQLNIHKYLNKFSVNLGNYSVKLGQRFHQDLKQMEESYQGLWDRHMMTDYFRFLKGDCLPENYKAIA